MKAAEDMETVLKAILQLDKEKLSAKLDVQVHFETDSAQADFLEFLRANDLFGVVSKIERLVLHFEDVFKPDPHISSEKASRWSRAILLASVLEGNTEEKDVYSA